MTYVEIEPCLLHVANLWYVPAHGLNRVYPVRGGTERRYLERRQFFVALGFWQGTPWEDHKNDHIVVGLLQSGELVAFPLISLNELKEEMLFK